VKPGDQVLIRRNPHREDADHVVGIVERIDEGTGFGGCDLVHVRYEDPWTGEVETMPFAPACLVAGSGSRLLEIAERFEAQAARLRAMVR